MRRTLLAVAVAALIGSTDSGAQAQTGAMAPRDGWWDLEHPCEAVLRHLLARGDNPAYDFSPQVQNTVRRGWAALFPVVVAVADDASLGADADRLQTATRQQVDGSVSGGRVYLEGTAARDAWRRVQAAVERGLTAYDAGQPVEPGLLRLMVLLSNPDVGYSYAQVGAYPAREPECGRPR